MLFQQLVSVRNLVGSRAHPGEVAHTHPHPLLVVARRVPRVQMIAPLRDTLRSTESLLLAARDEAADWKARNEQLTLESDTLKKQVEVRRWALQTCSQAQLLTYCMRVWLCTLHQRLSLKTDNLQAQLANERILADKTKLLQSELAKLEALKRDTLDANEARRTEKAKALLKQLLNAQKAIAGMKEHQAGLDDEVWIRPLLTQQLLASCCGG